MTSFACEFAELYWNCVRASYEKVPICYSNTTNSIIAHKTSPYQQLEPFCVVKVILEDENDRL